MKSVENPPKLNHELFICECNNVEHQLIFSYFTDEKEVYVTIHLLPEYNIWNRIIAAFKYIFGYKSRHGNFDEFIFQKEDADKLQSIVNHLRT